MVSGTAANGSAFPGGRLLYTRSTRHDGLVQTLDLTPSLLGWTGLSQAQISAVHPTAFTGAPITAAGSAPGGAGHAGPVIAAQADLDTANYVYGQTNGNFITAMADNCISMLYAAFGVFLLIRWLPARWSPDRFAMRKPASGQPTGWRRRAADWRRALAGLLGWWAAGTAAIAPGSFLAGLLPWSSSGAPGPYLYLSTIGFAVVLAAAALAASRLVGALRVRPLAPAGLLSLATLAIIGLDVMTGSHLQAQTPFGLSYTIAGRFFGIGNAAIGVYCASAMIGTAFLVSLVLPSRGPGVIPSAAGTVGAGGGRFRRSVDTLASSVPRLAQARGAGAARTHPAAGPGSWLRGRTGRGCGIRAGPACGSQRRAPDPAPGPDRGRAGRPVRDRRVRLAGLGRQGGRHHRHGARLRAARLPGRRAPADLAKAHRGGGQRGTGDQRPGGAQLPPAGRQPLAPRRLRRLAVRRHVDFDHPPEIDTNLGSIHNDWFSEYVPWILAGCLLALVVPRLIGSRSLALAYAREPYVRCAFWLTFITVCIGLFVDDSGILVPKMALFLAFPLAVLSVARSLGPDPGRPAQDGAGAAAATPVEGADNPGRAVPQ